MDICIEWTTLSLSRFGSDAVLTSKLLTFRISTLTKLPPKVSMSMKLPLSGRSSIFHDRIIGSFPVLAVNRNSHSVIPVVVGWKKEK